MPSCPFTLSRQASLLHKKGLKALVCFEHQQTLDLSPKSLFSLALTSADPHTSEHSGFSVTRGPKGWGVVGQMHSHPGAHPRPQVGIKKYTRAVQIHSQAGSCCLGGFQWLASCASVWFPTVGASYSFCPFPQVHVKSEVLAIKLSQEINYAKSLYYEQQLMLRLNENQEQLELDS